MSTVLNFLDAMRSVALQELNGGQLQKKLKAFHYTGRKQIRKAPQKATRALIGLVPYAGSGLQTVFDIAVNKYKTKLILPKKYNRARHGVDLADNVSDEELRELRRKLAKTGVKQLEYLTSIKLDGNLVKLKDCQAKFKTSYERLVQEATSESGVSYEALVGFAVSLYKTQYYENKLSVLADVLGRTHQDIVDYLTNCTSVSEEYEQELIDFLRDNEALLEEAQDEDEDDEKEQPRGNPLMNMLGRSSTYKRL